MNNLIQNVKASSALSDNLAALAQEDPEYLSELTAWAQSTDGLYTILKSDRTTTRPPVQARRPPIPPARIAAPAPARPRRRRGDVYSGHGARPPRRRRSSTLPARTASRARARRRPIRPAHTAPRAQARRRPIRPALTAVPGPSLPAPAAAGTYIAGTGATSAAAEIYRFARLLQRSWGERS